MIEYPNIDPVIVDFGYNLKITWYSLSYVFGILFGGYYAKFLSRYFKLKISSEKIDDFITWIIIGIIIGGRLGYVIFYKPLYYLNNPVEILKTYNGGMSFHGAILGILLSSYYFCRQYKLPLFTVLDLVAISAPFGIFFGRIANFINGELYGRETDFVLAMIFPDGGNVARHPSQLYEALIEGLLLFIIMQIAVFKFQILNKFSGSAISLFLIGYGTGRFFLEFFREPDSHLGLLILNLSMGQLLCLLMITSGFILTIRQIKNSCN